LAEMELSAADREEQLDAVTARIDQTRKAYQANGVELGAARERIQALKGRQASLEALQQAALEDHGEERAWLDGQNLGAAPRLAETLDVDAGWELAVETVLGDRLQAVCVDALDPLVAALDRIAKGELTLVAEAAATPTGAGGKYLAERVRGGAALPLLAGIHAADSLDAALALRPTLAPGESVVTPDGVWIGPNWARVARGRN